MQNERSTSQHGAAVVRYDGKRGTVWRIKYRDAEGVQVQETIGAERDGVTEKKAKAELRERLVRVERKGYRRPGRLTCAEYAEIWFEEGKRRRSWKPKTLLAYRNVLDHLTAELGPVTLGGVRPRDVAAYTSTALERFSPKTVQLQLNLLHDVFKTAKAEELVDSNPVEGAERPKVRSPRWRILEPAEIRRVLNSFTDDQARVVFLTLVLTGVRRFELQALRWRDLSLVEGVLRVRDSKSEEGVRSIALSPTLVAELEQHFRRTAFKGDDELVFCHPKRGSKIDAAAGASELAVMAKAGHRSMSTTKTYLHLAGVVFRDEAVALEERLLGDPAMGTKLYPSDLSSADLSAHEASEQADS
jgi:integrase